MAQKKYGLIVIILFLITCQSSKAQYWHYYNPSIWYDVNAVELLEPGVIAIGGGLETNDSVQVMFQTSDFGLTWTENNHDGLNPWNKSIAFSDLFSGFGVGDYGRIIKSDDAGKNWGYPVMPINRDLNKIIYTGAGTYYVAGGKMADTLQTILKSTNYGNTWSVIYDAHGFWLKSLFFKNNQTGFAVGDNGVILTTTNAGNTWVPITAPVQRDFNAIAFINADTGYIVGGTASALSRKTILITVNGGADWSVLLDANGGILNDISFAEPHLGYVVGDSATVLKTTDGGLNWTPILIDTNLTGSESFNAVKFYNKDFGAIGGKAGALYIYHNPVPLVYTLPATQVTLNAARLNGSVNAGGIPAAVKFEYGTTTAYGAQIDAVPDTVTDTVNVNAAYILSGLSPSTTYHYRLKAVNSHGTSYGQDRVFITGGPTATTIYVTNLTSSSAKLLGVVNANNFLTTIKFEYGTNKSYGNEIAAVPDTASGSANTNIFSLLSGLLAHTIYHYRVKATNVNGTIYGEDLMFFTDYPTPASTLPAMDITLNSARLNGTVDAGGFPMAIEFEYGTTTAYGSEINAMPDSSSTIGSINVYALLTGLTSNTTYHFRIKGVKSDTTNFGSDMLFFTGNCEIPNFNFELWTSDTLAKLEDWNITVGRISRCTTACKNSYAVKIQNDSISPGQPGCIFIGSPSNKGGFDFTGGTPFNARPDTLIGCFNYNIPNNDTALIILILKKQGIIISNNMFRIFGNSSGNYTNLKFPITYSFGGNADSIIIGFTVTDVRNLAHQLTEGGILMVDNIRFSGTNANIPNNDFENWGTNVNYSLDGWWYVNKSTPNPVHPLDLPVQRTTDVQNGNYAVRLQTFIYGDNNVEGKVYTNSHQQWFSPSFSVNAHHLMLTGYYKYFPQNNDTMSINISMFKNGTLIGGGSFFQNDTVTSYNPFSVDIVYAYVDIPDSASIIIQAFNRLPQGGSVLYVDNLNFDGFLAGVKEPALTSATGVDFNIYPNPFNDRAIVSFTLSKDENVMVRLFDLSGKQVALLAKGKYLAGSYKIDLSAEGLPKGFYIGVINTEKAVYSKKLIIY